MRIRKYNIAKKKPDPKLVPNIVSLCVIALTLVAAASVSRSTKLEKTGSEPLENAAVFTFSSETTAATTASTVHQTDESETTAVKETTDTASDTVTDTCASSDESTAEVTAESATETTASPSEATAEKSNNEEPAPEQPEEAQPEPEVTYKYRNGESEAEADGYAGKVHVKLTIENDVITSISAWADEDDTEYFGDAMNTVMPQIASVGSADGIDACSGATYSSNGIIEAARKALEQAVN